MRPMMPPKESTACLNAAEFGRAASRVPETLRTHRVRMECKPLLEFRRRHLRKKRTVEKLEASLPNRCMHDIVENLQPGACLRTRIRVPRHEGGFGEGLIQILTDYGRLRA